MKMESEKSEKQIRVYSYGCLPPDHGREVFDEQMRLAHHYQNKLVEIECARRVAVEKLHEAHPQLSTLAEDLELANCLFESALVEIKRCRDGNNAEDSAPARELYSAVQRELWALEKRWTVAKREVRKADPILKEALRAPSTEAYAQVRAARAECGVYWGTYLTVEAAADAANESIDPPRFKRYKGEGQIAVQLQGGLSVPELLSCTDPRLRMAPEPQSPNVTSPKTIAKRWRIWIRAGSEGRAPIWVSAPIVLHRPLPEGATIQWARITRHKVSYREEYRCQFVIVMPAEEDVSSDYAAGYAREGIVAVDLGWRHLNNDTRLRAGYRVDSTGQHESIDVIEPIVSALDKSEDLSSIRGKNLDLVRNRLLEYIGVRSKPRPSTIPEWLWEDTRSLWQWGRPQRFAGLLRKWSTARFDGDEALYNTLDAWAKQDRHLWSWEAHGRDGAINRRRDYYRSLAAQLAKTYGTIVIEAKGKKGLDLTTHKLAERPYPDADENPNDGRRQRKGKKRAACGELRECILAAAGKYGAKVVEVEPAATTYRCHDCGFEGAWDQTELMHTCACCGKTWDQDYNACMNLLARASGKMMGPTDAALAMMRMIEKTTTAMTRKGGKVRKPKAPRKDRSIEHRQETVIPRGI